MSSQNHLTSNSYVSPLTFKSATTIQNLHFTEEVRRSTYLLVLFIFVML
jgi:hypothetical protein